MYMAAWLLLPTTAWAGEQPVPSAAATPSHDAMLRDDYIRASLLVISPGCDAYSLFGHCALRLECPSQQMDYCFTFEGSTDTEGLLNFFRGRSMGGFVPAATDEYIDYYRGEGRSVTEYVLLLTPQEELSLWRNVDTEIARGFCHHYDYMHAQCTSKLVELVERVVEPRNGHGGGTDLVGGVTYGSLPTQLHGSFRDQMLVESERYPWSRFFWQTIMGPAGDDTEPVAQKITPRHLPAVWQHAIVGGAARPLAAADGELIVAATAAAASSVPSPTLVGSVLLLIVVIVTAGQWLRRWRRLPAVADVLLAVAHTLLALALTWLVLFSTLEATEWNWYLPVFCPLWLLLWLLCRKCRRPVCLAFLATVVATLALTPFVPQLDMAHALFIAAIGIRLIWHSKKQ